MVSHLIPIDSYIDRPRQVKEEIELLKKATKFISDKKLNRLASSHIGMKPEEFTMKHSILTGTRTFTSAMRDSPRRKTGVQDKPWKDSKVADMWPELHTRPLTALIPLNKKSIMKSQFIEDYPFRPAYIDSPIISTRGLIGEGFQVSRPVQIQSKRFDILNAGQHDLSPQREREMSQKLIEEGLQKNSTTVWMEEYSSLGKKHDVETSEAKRSFKVTGVDDNRCSGHLEKIKALEHTLSEMADREEIIERSLASMHGSQASLKNIPAHNSRTAHDVFNRVNSAKSLTHKSEDPRESVTKHKKSSEAAMSFGHVTPGKIVSGPKEAKLVKHANETRMTANLSPTYKLAARGDFSKASVPSFSECCAEIVHNKRVSEQAAGEMVIGMPSNLYNLYQVIKRRPDANFFTKRDLQLLLTRLDINCNILTSDTLYEVLDHGRDGVVCFSDFERTLLPRDHNLLHTSRSSQTTNCADLDKFPSATVHLFQRSMTALVQLAEALNVMRKYYWREINTVKKSSTASLREVTKDRLGTSSSDELEFVKKIIVSC